jgi:hypothetical protein
MRVSKAFQLSLSVPLLTVAAYAAGAQATTPSIPASADVTYQNIAGVNPIGLIPGILSAEVEHIIAPGFTIGVGGTHQSLLGRNNYDVQSSWLDAKAMYYPAESGFAGFSVDVTAGLLSSHGAHAGDKAQPIQHNSGGTIGIVGDYNWFTGRAQLGLAF